MQTSPNISSSSAGHPRIPLRLALKSSGRSSLVDGAWWPQSADLESESADLVDGFPPDTGRVSRLLYSRPDWTGPGGLRRVRVSRGTVKIGSFPSDDTHLMVVRLQSGDRLRLAVIPWDCPRQKAEQILKRASDDGDDASAADLLGIAHPRQETVGEEVWDDDSGSHPL
ncbi:hypothetical protein KUV85_06170 [Nocardioides panacisoli]|uniref:DUF5994 family protein n=1 Tax=Nocardioides panacisoli TaxID=627624 RepID=UPI001C63ACBB|nr:DUF5994 family protein [Nocardioides panacisoli]QYJ05258.1 hypothetical protein KUV85_06170 [Nocardioides panacisoli]